MKSHELIYHYFQDEESNECPMILVKISER